MANINFLVNNTLVISPELGGTQKHTTGFRDFKMSSDYSRLFSWDWDNNFKIWKLNSDNIFVVDQ